MSIKLKQFGQGKSYPLQRPVLHPPVHGMHSLGAQQKLNIIKVFHCIPWNIPTSNNFGGAAFPFSWHSNFFTDMNHPFSPPVLLFHRIFWTFFLAPSRTSCFYAQTMTTFLFPLMYKPNIFITNMIQSPILFLLSPPFLFLSRNNNTQ